MNFNPKQLIGRYRKLGNGDLYHSQYQFDLTQSIVNETSARGHDHVREVSYALSSLLAHWGMFRTSGQLINKNSLFFEDLIKCCVISKRPALRPIMGVPFEKLDEVPAYKIDASLDQLRQWLRRNEISPTDTLTSKIVLGLLGNIPGHDRYFKRGLAELKKKRVYKGTQKLCGKNIHELVTMVSRYQWPSVENCADNRLRLPYGRLVDMATFQFGLEFSR